MIHPSVRGFPPKGRMIGYFGHFFSEVIFLGLNHPMYHPRIILPNSEPDQNEAIILAPSTVQDNADREQPQGLDRGIQINLVAGDGHARINDPVGDITAAG